MASKGSNRLNHTTNSQTGQDPIAHSPKDAPWLFALFGESAPATVPVDARQVPQPARSLLAHESHMTVTLEAHHKCPVDLTILASAREGVHYARKILLSRSTDGFVVQFGIMRFDFKHCTETVRDLILEGQTPLGRILIENGVLRRLTLHQLVQVQPTTEILEHFGRPQAEQPIYGRLATIHCDGQPAVDLLEIVNTR